MKKKMYAGIAVIVLALAAVVLSSAPGNATDATGNVAGGPDNMASASSLEEVNDVNGCSGGRIRCTESQNCGRATCAAITGGTCGCGN